MEGQCDDSFASVNSTISSSSHSATTSPVPASPVLPSNSFCSRKKDVVGSPCHQPGTEFCPCCQRYISNRPDSPPSVTSEMNDDVTMEMDEVTDEKVVIKQILVDGPISKKGSGKDYLGSTEWKLRWAKLALTEVKGYDVDVPTLLIYWYPFSPNPSNYILLDGSVIIPSDEKTTEGRLHCFDIVPVGRCKHPVNDHKKVGTRTFSAPLKERNQWVHAMNVSLNVYEKSKAKKKIEKLRSQLPLSPPRSPPSVQNFLLPDVECMLTKIPSPTKPIPLTRVSTVSTAQDSIKNLSPTAPKLAPSRPNLPLPRQKNRSPSPIARMQSTRKENSRTKLGKDPLALNRVSTKVRITRTATKLFSPIVKVSGGRLVPKVSEPIPTRRARSEPVKKVGNLS